MSSCDKTLPFIERNGDDYTLNWNSWKFTSKKKPADHSAIIPEFEAQVSDETMYQTVKTCCKELSEKMDCLVQCDSFSPINAPGTGFHGCFEKGVDMGFSPLRSPDEIKKSFAEIQNTWHLLDIKTVTSKFTI